MSPGCCSYIHGALDDIRGTARGVLPLLRELAPNSIVVTGVSGLLIAPAVLALWSKSAIPSAPRLVIVRKPHGGSHSRHIMESLAPVSRWVFLDDLIESGKTVNRVRRCMARYDDSEQFLGAVLYTSLRFVPPEFIPCPYVNNSAPATEQGVPAAPTPDVPPADPEARKDWKSRYFAKNYGGVQADPEATEGFRHWPPYSGGVPAFDPPPGFLGFRAPRGA